MKDESLLLPNLIPSNFNPDSIDLYWMQKYIISRNYHSYHNDFLRFLTEKTLPNDEFHVSNVN